MHNITNLKILPMAIALVLTLGACKKGGEGTGVEDVDPEFVVNVEELDDQMNPVVVAMPSGLFLVVWQSGCENECPGQDGSESPRKR